MGFHVLSELKRLSGSVNSIEVEMRKIDSERGKDVEKRHLENVEALTEIKENIAALKVKASLWGALGGAIVATGGFIMAMVKKS